MQVTCPIGTEYFGLDDISYSESFPNKNMHPNAAMNTARVVGTMTSVLDAYNIIMTKLNFCMSFLMNSVLAYVRSHSTNYKMYHLAEKCKSNHTRLFILAPLVFPYCHIIDRYFL
jgi:hypothetical protein